MDVIMFIRLIALAFCMTLCIQVLTAVFPDDFFYDLYRKFRYKSKFVCNAEHCNNDKCKNCKRTGWCENCINYEKEMFFICKKCINNDYALVANIIEHGD